MTDDPGITHEFINENTDDSNARANGETCPSDWNAEHKILGMYGWQLIEEQDVNDVSSVVFNDLDGDNDEEYMIEIDNVQMFCSSSGSIGTLVVQPNGVNTNFLDASGAFNARNQTGNSSRANVGFVLIDQYWISNDNTTYFANAEMTIKAKSGNPRTSINNATVFSPAVNYGFRIVGGGQWYDTTTNITNLVISIINSSTGTFTGTIRLYNKLPLS